MILSNEANTNKNGKFQIIFNSIIRIIVWAAISEKIISLASRLLTEKCSEKHMEMFVVLTY